MPRQQMQAMTFASTAMEPSPTPTLMAEIGLLSLPQAILNVYQGDDTRWLFRLKKADDSPFDLTGYTAAAQFRTDVADTAIAVAAEPLVEVTDDVGGEITMTLSSELSTMLVQPLYVWDLEITETAASWTTTVASGTVVVTKEVTRE